MNEPPVPGLMLAALLGVAACAVLTWLFVWRYSRVTWQDTPEGRHLMRFSALLGITFTATLVLNAVPTPAMVRGIISVLLFWALAAELWTRVALLTIAQREETAQARQDETATP